MTDAAQKGEAGHVPPVKKALRDAMRKRRRAMSAEDRRRASESVCAKLSSMCLKGPVAVYLAAGGELDLSPFIRHSLAASLPLLAPRWNGSLYEIAPLAGLGAGELRTGPMGIPEPYGTPAAGFDVPCTWLVPGLAFTLDGRRLGYGGGWYDRMLQQARPDAFVVGVGYAFQVVVELPQEAHDVMLSAVVCDADAGHLL